MSLAKMDDVVAANSINSKSNETTSHEKTSCCATLDENPSCKFELKQCFPCIFDPLGYLVKDRLPFLGWLGMFECFRWFNGVIKWLSKRVTRFPHCGKVYNIRTGVADLVAGVTVGIMVVPQALAYAKIATVPIEYGLFSSFMGVFVYALFGTSKDVTLGPTAILSLITASAISNCTDKVACATLLTFLCGLVQLVMGIFNLGFLIDFIPLPVISGFTSAAAITIAGGQLKHLIGVKTSGHRPIFDFVISMKETLWQLPNLNPWDLLLGVCCIALVVFLQFFKIHNEKIFKRLERPNLLQKIIHKILWLLCTARSGVVVFIGGLIGVAVWYRPCTYGSCDHPLTFVNYTEDNTPSFRPPPFSSSMIEELGIGIAMAPLIGFLETIAISKAFARQNEYTINPTQELIAIGLANLASSFVGSYPVTGSFSRTAVNSQSGVQTPAAGIYTGCVVLLAIYLLGPAFNYIPTTALAAIIIPAVLYMFDWRIVWSIWKVRKMDLIPLVVAFIGTIVFGVEYGVPAACLLYILMLLYREARTRHKVVKYDGILCLELNGGWNYPSINYIWNRVYAEINSQGDIEGGKHLRAVVFICTGMPEIDYTTIMGFKDGCKDLKRLGLQLFIVGAQDHVINMLCKADKDLNIYPSLNAVLEFLGDSDNENVGERTGLLSSSKN